MILEMSCDSIWTLSFGLSQFHGHDSWLVCEAALRCAYVQVTSIDWPNEIHTLNKTLSLTHTHLNPLQRGKQQRAFEKAMRVLYELGKVGTFCTRELSHQ